MADEVQHGHYNDGYNPCATQPTVATSPYDQRQSHYSQYNTTQYSVPYEQNQYDPNQPYRLSDTFQNPYPDIPSTFAPQPLPDLFEQQQPQEDDHPGATYNPYDSQPTLAPGTRLQSQFGGASYDVRDEEVDAGGMPLLQRETPYPRTTLLGGYEDVPGDTESIIRYGRIPQRVPQQYKTLKKVELFHGNLVLDSAVPSKPLDMFALCNERESEHM